MLIIKTIPGPMVNINTQTRALPCHVSPPNKIFIKKTVITARVAKLTAFIFRLRECGGRGPRTKSSKTPRMTNGMATYPYRPNITSRRFELLISMMPVSLSAGELKANRSRKGKRAVNSVSRLKIASTTSAVCSKLTSVMTDRMINSNPQQKTIGVSAR